MTSRERKSAKRSRAHKAFLAYLRDSAVLVGVKRYPRTLGFTVPKSPGFWAKRIKVGRTLDMSGDKPSLVNATKLVPLFRPHIPYGFAGKSRNAPSLMRERDANKHKITVFKGVSGRHWILDDAGEHHKHKVECIIRKD